MPPWLPNHAPQQRNDRFRGRQQDRLHPAQGRRRRRREAFHRVGISLDLYHEDTVQRYASLWHATVGLWLSNHAVHPAIREARVPEDHFGVLPLRRQSPRVRCGLSSPFYSKPLPNKMLLSDIETYHLSMWTPMKNSPRGCGRVVGKPEAIRPPLRD